MQAWLGSALVNFMALGRLAPDTMWLADPDGAGDTQAVASVTQVQGHRAPPSAIEAQCGMLHLLGGAAVYLRLAPASRVPCLAVAGEICAQVLAGTPIHTRAPEAGGGGYLTVPPGEAWGTVTLVFADVVKAGASVVTGARGTRIWLPDLTVPPGEAIRAAAVVLAARLLARASIPAGPRAAQVWPGFLAVPAVEPAGTLARVGVVVGITGASVEAGVGVAGRRQWVTDVVVGVADAEVAPAILHAVAPVGALRVHVAGRGRDFEFAEEPKEARGALAEGGVGSQASATVVTLTVVLGGSLPAVQAHEAFWALAHVALICVHTGSPVLARGRQTGVGHGVASCLAARSLEGLCAQAGEVPHEVHTRASVKTRVGAAFVQVRLANDAGVAGLAHAHRGAAVCLALAAIRTLFGVTWRQCCLTGGSPEAIWAMTAEAVDAMCAGPAVLTRVRCTLVHIQVAPPPREA